MTMKTLVAIWVAALISGVGTVTYVNAAINENVARSQAEQLQPAATGSDELLEELKENGII